MDGSRLLGGGSPCGSYRGGAYGRMADEDCTPFNSQGGGLDVTYEFCRAFQFHAVRDCYIADDLAVDDNGFGIDFRPDDGVLAYGKHPFGGQVAAPPPQPVRGCPGSWLHPSSWGWIQDFYCPWGRER